jgi:glycine/serine hydroxymethyltransferase
MLLQQRQWHLRRLTAEFKHYQLQIIKNAKELSEALMKRGLKSYPEALIRI